MSKYNIYKLRILYRISIDCHMFPLCPLCHEPIKTQEELSIDHIKPSSHGGSDDITNLQPMHIKCNSKKGSTVPKQPENKPDERKKHGKHHSGRKEKQRNVVKGRTTEELLQKCQIVDRVRSKQPRVNAHVRGG